MDVPAPDRLILSPQTVLALSILCDKATNKFDIVVIIMIIALKLNFQSFSPVTSLGGLPMAPPASLVIWEYLSLTQRIGPQPGCCFQTVFILLIRRYPEF